MLKGDIKCCTHMFCSTVRLPRLNGMVPLSRLVLRSLRAQAGSFSAVQGRPAAPGTHRFVNPVRLLRLDGMVPLRELLKKTLRAQSGRLSTVQGAVARCVVHVHFSQTIQAAQAGWDGAAELVV